MGYDNLSELNPYEDSTRAELINRLSSIFIKSIQSCNDYRCYNCKIQDICDLLIGDE